MRHQTWQDSQFLKKLAKFSGQFVAYQFILCKCFRKIFVVCKVLASHRLEDRFSSRQPERNRKRQGHFVPGAFKLADSLTVPYISAFQHLRYAVIVSPFRATIIKQENLLLIQWMNQIERKALRRSSPHLQRHKLACKYCSNL